MSHRSRASLIHLLISLFLVSAILSLVILIWYPRPYFDAMGISGILLMLAAVDVTIGPLITFIIFKPNKPSLKFDLTVIALLQCAALAYGCSTVLTGRPVYVVYNVDRFTVVTQGDIPPAELARAGNPAMPLNGPQVVGARLPQDPEELKRILFSSIGGGADLAQMPAYYLPYKDIASEVTRKILSLDLLFARQSTDVASAREAVASALTQAGLTQAEVGFLPLRAKTSDLSVLVRRTDAAIIAILPVDPWGI